MLTELQVKNTKPKEKPYILRDDRALYLRIDSSERKYWILRYWENGKEHKLSLSPYPDLSLKDARLKRDEIQSDRAKGKSPSLKSANIPQIFSEATREWLKVRMKDKAEGYLKTIHYRLNKYILPMLGDFLLKNIMLGNILQICRRVEDSGHDETAKRVKTIIGQSLPFCNSRRMDRHRPNSRASWCAPASYQPALRNIHESRRYCNPHEGHQSVSLHHNAVCAAFLCVYRRSSG